MLIRCRHARRIQTYLKLSACLLFAICYGTFLFRESLNALQHNRDISKSKDNDNDFPTSNNNLQEQRKILQINIHKKQLPTITTTLATATSKIIDSTLNPVYDYSEEQHRATEKNLHERYEHLKKKCSTYKLESYFPPKNREFFISPGHNLVWCNVFKAASSTWMYYFNILGGYDIKYLQRSETQPLELARKRFPRPDLSELMENLPSAISFLFVREPFERIVSGYRDKLEGGKNSYYKSLGIRIVRKIRQHKQHPPVHGPTFQEFIEYLIVQHEEGKTFDEHWAPIYSFCTPCSVNFSIIGKVETFHRDSEFIIRQAGLESLLLGTLPKHKLRKIGNQAKTGIKTDEMLVIRYFSELNRNTLDQLLKIYHLDFELFDYDFTKYYSYVQPVYETSFSSISNNITNSNSNSKNNNSNSNNNGTLS